MKPLAGPSSPTRHGAQPPWLRRINHIAIDSHQLLLVHDAIERDPALAQDPWRLLAALPAPLHGDWQRLQAVLLRLQALAALFEDGGTLPGWVGAADDDGVVRLSATTMEAAARCPLVRGRPHPRFERSVFLELLLASTVGQGNA